MQAKTRALSIDLSTEVPQRGTKAVAELAKLNKIYAPPPRGALFIEALAELEALRGCHVIVPPAAGGTTLYRLSNSFGS